MDNLNFSNLYEGLIDRSSLYESMGMLSEFSRNYSARIAKVFDSSSLAGSLARMTNLSDSLKICNSFAETYAASFSALQTSLGSVILKNSQMQNSFRSVLDAANELSKVNIPKFNIPTDLLHSIDLSQFAHHHLIGIKHLVQQ